MIRVSKHSLKFVNKIKQQSIQRLFKQYKEALQIYIKLITQSKLPFKHFLSSKQLPDTVIKHSRFKQVVYKNAAEIVYSNLNYTKNKTFNKYKKLYKKCIEQHKHQNFTNKHYKQLNINYLKRIKVNLKNINITLDNRFFDMQKTTGQFNQFVRVTLPWFKEGKKRAETIKLPVKYHKQSLKFQQLGFTRCNSIQLQLKNSKYFINYYWQKQTPKQQQQPNFVGIDQGYNKLISDSNGVHWGKELKQIYLKLANKQRRKQKLSTNFNL